MRNNDLCIILQKRHRFVTKAQARKCSKSQKNNRQPKVRQTRRTDGGERDTESQGGRDGRTERLAGPSRGKRMKTLCFCVWYSFLLEKQRTESHGNTHVEFSAPKKDIRRCMGGNAVDRDPGKRGRKGCVQIDSTQQS